MAVRIQVTRPVQSRGTQNRYGRGEAAGMDAVIARAHKVRARQARQARKAA